MGVHETKTFKSGNSEAVRLPKGMGFGIGVELEIAREGERLVLTPKTSAAAEKRRLRELLDALGAIGRPDDGVQSRPDFEPPDRPGL
jgi:antitoxin VapB